MIKMGEIIIEKILSIIELIQMKTILRNQELLDKAIELLRGIAKENKI